MRTLERTWTDTALIEAVQAADSMAEVLRRLGLVPAGGNHESIGRHIKRLGLTFDHFTRGARNKALRRVTSTRSLTFEEIFCEGSLVASLARYVKKYAVFPYTCDDCGNSGIHNGKPLSLQVDHRNGVGNDNLVENLRYLCPNCHSQTETFAGKSSNTRTRPKRIVPKRLRQSQRKVPYEQLVSRYHELGVYRKVAAEFGVSDMTVRKAVSRTNLRPTSLGPYVS